MFNPNREEPQPKPRGFNNHEVTAVDQAAEIAEQAEEAAQEDPQP